MTIKSYLLACHQFDLFIMAQLQRSVSERLRRVFQLQRGVEGPQDAALLRHDGQPSPEDSKL